MLAIAEHVQLSMRDVTPNHIVLHSCVIIAYLYAALPHVSIQQQPHYTPGQPHATMPVHLIVSMMRFTKSMQGYLLDTQPCHTLQLQACACQHLAVW